ncbi:MAG: ribonuclease domain-containing protein [Thermomicrobiales bacterium]
MRERALFGRTLAATGLLLALLALLAACGTFATPTSAVAVRPTFTWATVTAPAAPAIATTAATHGQPTRAVTATRARPTATAAGKGATIAFAQLPPEAQATIRLIDKGGPFPYRQDGTVFGNREGLLPPEPDGYYHEYTVDTPGSADRGARRVIGGRDGTLYYTDDHYASFKKVVR